MAIQPSSAERMVRAGAVGGIVFANAQSMLADGDLTSIAAANAAIDTANAKKHVAEKTFGERGKASVNMIDNYLAGASSGGSVANIAAVDPARGHFLRF